VVPVSVVLIAARMLSRLVVMAWNTAIRMAPDLVSH
jgi:hypothetical protein